MPGTFIPILLGGYVLTAASGVPPKIDALATCKATEDIISSLFGNQTMVSVENCMRHENGARAQIEKDWPTYPASDRALCTAKAYMPNYVEWLTCLEMFRDVRKLRAEGPNSPTAPASGCGRQPRRSMP
jgi:hypothetical protein